MPSKSKAQHNLMEAVAHSPSFAKKVGIKQSVGKEFSDADKGKKFKKGGMMKHDDIKEDKALIKKAFGMHDKQEHKGQHTDLTKLKQGGNTMKRKSINPLADMAAARALAGPAAAPAPMMAPPAAPAGPMPGMKKGGETMGPRTMAEDVEKGSNKLTKFGQSAVQKRGLTKGKNLGDSGPTKMAKGGSASSRADGIASKGKTRGKWC
jgi:hypothetical protein